LLDGASLIALLRNSPGLVHPDAADGNNRCDYDNESFLKGCHGDGLGEGSGCRSGRGDGSSSENDGGGNAGGEAGGRGLDSIGGDDSDQGGCTNRDTASGKEFAHSFDGAADAFSGRLLVCSEGLADLKERLVLKVTEQHGGSLGFVERVHGFVNEGFDVCPIGSGSVYGGEFHSDFFPNLPSGLAADYIDGRAASDLVQPRAEDRVRLEAIRLTGQVDEDRLGYFLSKLRRANLAKRGGKDEVEVTADDLREGILGMVSAVVSQQLKVGITHFYKYIAAFAETGREKTVAWG
jgi:hypothetical protein